MSILEKKALAFEKLNADVKLRIYNLSVHTEAISQQYDETLKKLAE